MPGMRVLSCYGDGGEEFLAECYAHLKRSRLFPTAGTALAYAREHNRALHRGGYPLLVRRALVLPSTGTGPSTSTG
jgi:hypothetical protein